MIHSLTEVTCRHKYKATVFVSITYISRVLHHLTSSCICCITVAVKLEAHALDELSYFYITVSVNICWWFFICSYTFCCFQTNTKGNTESHWSLVYYFSSSCQSLCYLILCHTHYSRLPHGAVTANKGSQDSNEALNKLTLIINVELLAVWTMAILIS